MLTSDTVAAIFAHAEKDYPSECCGIVTGGGGLQQVHRCRNLQDELHEMDPESHPRTSHEAYAIDRREMEKIIREEASNGRRVIAFYHSHIECGAYFSSMDKEVQTVFGSPEFPEALHVVVSVQKGKAREIRGFLWSEEKQDFVVLSVT